MCPGAKYGLRGRGLPRAYEYPAGFHRRLSPGINRAVRINESLSRLVYADDGLQPVTDLPGQQVIDGHADSDNRRAAFVGDDGSEGAICQCGHETPMRHFMHIGVTGLQIQSHGIALY